MASPFRVFRKYQKTLLVVAGVILMFVFVIGDALVGYLGGSRGGGDSAREAGEVAVRWDGGSLTNAELQNLVTRRRIVNSFIQGVEFEGRRAALQAGIQPRNLRVEPIIGADTPQQGIEQSVVRARLFADAAREAGMSVSNETIVQYLDELGRGNVTRDDMRAMLNRLQTGGPRVSIDYVIDALREEMLARNFIASHRFAFETVTPQQRWDDWLNVNDRIVVEAGAVPAESFVIDVKEPTDPELAKFFDDHKNREPQPDFIGQMEFPSATPGFRIPRKIDVQFIQANYDQFLAKVEGEITEEEIAKYYEENKDPHFIKADTSLIDDEAKTEDAESTGEAAVEDAATERSATPPGDTHQEGGEADTSTESESSAEPGEAPEGEPSNEQTPPAKKGGGEAAPAESDQSSRDGTSSNRVFRLAAFLQEGETSTAATEVPTESTESSAAETTDAGSEAEATASASDPASPTDALVEQPSAPGDIADPSAASPPASSEKPKEFQPLNEVRDLIRRRLAEGRAAEQMDELMDQLASQLNADFNSYFGKVLDAQAAERDPPPPPPALANLAPLAEKNGLQHGSTGPKSILELRDTAVGKSGSSETGVPLWQTVFVSRDLEQYQPIVTMDVDGNRFLALKMSDTPGRTPELADVKEDVVRAWKLQQAAELARKHAEELAKKTQDAGSTLTDYFADDKLVEVVRTDPFSHFTGGDVAVVNGRYQQQPFRLSQPDGIVAAGDEFLRGVFKLKEGEVGAIQNHDRSIAYVVRIVEHQDSPDELRTAYLAEADTWPGLGAMMGLHTQVAQSLLVRDIVADTELEWQRPADQIEQDEEEEG